MILIQNHLYSLKNYGLSINEILQTSNFAFQA